MALSGLAAVQTAPALRISDGAVRRMPRRAAAGAREAADCSGAAGAGTDGTSCRRGQSCIPAMADLGGQRAIGVTEGRGRGALRKGPQRGWRPTAARGPPSGRPRAACRRPMPWGLPMPSRRPSRPPAASMCRSPSPGPPAGSAAGKPGSPRGRGACPGARSAAGRSGRRASRSAGPRGRPPPWAGACWLPGHAPCPRP
jgi:hypothetical protein